MKITKSWIKKWEPCEEAVEWLEEQDTKDVFVLIERLKKSDIEDKYSWIFWAIPRLLKNKKDRVRFTVYCAELALPIFEKAYPNDKRPREAIQATQDWLKNPTEKNREAARAAAGAVARAAARADAWAAAWAAARAAAWANAWAAARADAWAAAGAAEEKAANQIIDYGVKLLEEG